MAKLELLASSPGTGKTTYCIDLFRKEILKSPAGIDSRSYFVLPNREHADRIQNLILKKGVPGLFNVHILTLQDLTQRFLGAKAEVGPGEILRQSLLRSILEDPDIPLPYFDRVRDLKGFHKLLSETLQEFKSALLDIPEFERRAQPLLKDPVFKAKYRDMSIVMKGYEEKLRALGLAEPEDNILRLAEETAEGERAELVIFDGFYHFSRAQQRLIELVASRSRQVMVTLTLPPALTGREFVFDYPNSTRDFLLGIGFESVAFASKASRRSADPALQHLEQNLFRSKPVRFKGAQSSVQILEAESARGEMEMIAREIRRLHRDERYHYSDFCIVLRSLDGRQKTLETVFADFDLPVHVHERKKLLESGAARFLDRFLMAAAEGWTAEHLSSLLRSNYWPAASPEEALKGLIEKKDALLAAKSGREFSHRLLRLAESLSCSSGPAGERDASALASLGKFIRSIETTEGASFSSVWTVQETRRLLEAGLFSSKPPGKNRVQVYDVVMALPKEYKVVFIGELLEGSFPKQAPEHPLLKDGERRQLNGRTPLLEERVRRVSGEHYFFYMAVTRARERLYLCYPLKDSEGRPALSSFFVQEVRACFSWEGLLSQQAASRPLLPAQCQAIREAERGLTHSLFSEGAPAGIEGKRLLALAAVWGKKERFRRVLETGYRGNKALLRDAAILGRMSQEKGPFSSTQLKAFVTCAFQHFSKYNLGLAEPPGEHERQWMGNVLHDTLYEYFASGRTAPPSEILDRLFKQSPFGNESPFRQKVYLESLRRTLALFERREAELASKRALVPSHFEAAFGKKVAGRAAAFGPLEIGDDSILLQGALDRVDLTPDGKKALVVDYKLGKRSLKKNLEQGLELQLPIYLLAAKKLLGVEPMGAELRFLEKGEEEGIYVETAREALGFGAAKKMKNAEEFTTILDNAERAIEEAVARLRRGDIAIDSISCDYCAFNAVCRYEKWRKIYDQTDE